MICLLTIIVSILLCAVCAMAGYYGVRMASEGEDAIAWWRLMLAACLGGLPFTIGAMASGLSPAGDAYRIMALTLMGSLLLVAALVDRDTAWAPDVLVLPLMALSLPISGFLEFQESESLFNLEGSAIYSAGLGVAIYLVMNGVWLCLYWISSRFESAAWRYVPPPADLLAAVLPIFIFGTSTCFFVVMISVVLLNVLARIFPGIARVFTNPEIHAKILLKRDENDMVDAPETAIAFLALQFPIVWLALFVNLLSGGMA